MGDSMLESAARMIYSIEHNTKLGKAIETVTLNDYGIFTPNGMVDKVIRALGVIGAAICALFFIMSLMDLAMSDRFSIETFAKHFVNLAIGYFCVVKAHFFAEFGWGLSKWVSELLSGYGALETGEAGGEITRAMLESSPICSALLAMDVSGAKWIGVALPLLLFGLLGLIASAIAVAAVYIAGFSRLLEIGLRACFMPIGLAFMTDDGWKGAGSRYLKKFLALCCQGPAYILIGKLHGSIMAGGLASIIESFTTGHSLAGLGDCATLLGILLAGSFATVSLLFKTGSIINDVFGV